MQKAQATPEADETQTMCCTVPVATTDWSTLTTEERVLIEQLQERNCLFRDDIGASIPTQ